MLIQIRPTDFIIHNASNVATKTNLDSHEWNRIHDEIFGYKFVKSEFKIGNFRMDTIAYNPETRAFVILEYKNTKNDSLIDQGYSYLNAIINKKADLILLYKDAFNEFMPIDYFDWSETRVVFISTSLGQYQKSAISISRPFDLYQITLYEDNLINLEKIVNEFSEEINFESKEVKTKEVKVYTVEDQLGGVSQDLKDLYDQIKEYALSLDSEIIVKPTKLYIAFKINLKRNFFSISFKKNQIEIDLNIRKNELNDAFKLAYDISNRQYSKTHWAIDVDSSTDFEKIEFYLKQAYTLNK